MTGGRAIVYLAGVIAADAPEPSLATAAELARAGAGGLQALLAASPSAAADAARRAARVTAVLPGGRRACFTGADDAGAAAAAAAWLAPRAEEIRDWLDALGERSEFVISIRPTEAPSAERGAGYLAQRAAAARRLAAVERRIFDALRGAQSRADVQTDREHAGRRHQGRRDGAPDALGGAPKVARQGGGSELSLLWPRADATGFAGRLAPVVRATTADWTIRASGPWPAYSFAPAEQASIETEAGRRAAAGDR